MSLSIRLTEKNEKSLREISSRTGRPKAFFVNQALEEYLEDQMDYLEACRVLSETRAEDIQEFKVSDYVV